MLYINFIQKAKDICITQDEDNGIWYVEPEWVDIMHRSGIGDLEDISDGYITDWLDVQNILELEVKRRNIRQFDKITVVTDWLYDLITATVEPAMLSEETDYIKAVTEFMKENHKQEKVE